MLRVEEKELNPKPRGFCGGGGPVKKGFPRDPSQRFIAMKTLRLGYRLKILWGSCWETPTLAVSKVLGLGFRVSSVRMKGLGLQSKDLKFKD